MRSDEGPEGSLQVGPVLQNNKEIGLATCVFSTAQHVEATDDRW